jgi:hypothetical protein
MHLGKLLQIHLLLATLLCATASHASEMRALIVGVSEYPNLAKQLQLEGPRNDVVRARDVLTQRGFAMQNIKVLADGVSGAALPTRNNILAELDRFANTAGKDDFIFLYFAGHGSQQPADLRTAEGRAEADGLYETFLPRDVGQWSGSVGTVKNALIKTELRDAVDRILAKGAFVWGVFDTCHSATLVRGENAGVNYRYVNPKDLGVPQAALDAARQNAAKGQDMAVPMIATATSANAGGSVFFYATQTSEATPEMVLPKGQGDGKYFGLFSYTLMQALETGVPMTYRQLTQYVLTRYGAMNETRVTPLFSGTALDQPVLFQNTQLVQQWKIEAGHEPVIQAGALSQLHEGAIMAVMADPLAGNDAAIGYLKLARVGLATSTAVPVEYHNKSALKPEAIPERSFARVVQNPPQYTLRVSVDASGCGDRCTTNVVVDELRKTKSSVPGTTIKWLASPASGNVLLKLLPDRILLLPPSMQGVDCASSCDQASVLLPDSNEQGNESLRDKLAASLHAIARTTNLLRIASSLADEGNKNSKLEVTLKVIKKNGTELPFVQGQVPNLVAGDRINVSLRNNGLSSVDVTMLYVDARYGINVLYPHGPGASNRLEPRASVSFGIAINDQTFGLERLLTIAVEAGKLQERADFSFLAQTPLSISKDAKRDETDPDVMAFMDAGYAAFQTRQNNAAPQAPSSRTSMQVFTLNVAR